MAAFRIVEEALTNVVRHARADRCSIAIVIDEASGALAVTVEDDGVGLPAEPRYGIGLQSMRERAEELGGTLVVEPGTTGGTRVRAELPCHPVDEGTCA